MPIDDTTTFEISTKGNIDDDVIERARERLGRVSRHCREAVTHVELRVTDDPNHPDQAHARAEATLVVKRGPVRAHAQAGTIAEAVDLMVERLRRRVDRHEAKLHRIGSKKHDGVTSPGSWKHGDVEFAPRHAPPVNEQAKIVRRKTFAAAPMSVEEALFDMDILDHRFYLFQNHENDETCVLSMDADGEFTLAVDGDELPAIPADVEITHAAGPVVLDDESAQRLLAAGEDPFIFYRSSPVAQAHVLYRRFDGDLGLIELDESASVNVTR